MHLLLVRDSLFRMNSLIIASFLLFFSGVSAAPPCGEFTPEGQPAHCLQWLDADGATIWTASIRGKSGPPNRATEPIHAKTWHLPLDSMTLRLLDGAPIATDDLLGSVVVFDFWASWCEPCRQELPLMQAFHEENQERGLHTFAVNVDEPPSTARATARVLGLDLPIVEYTAELRAAFAVTQLPTVVLVDRAGQIRGRWELFKDGTEERIFWAVGEMLDIAGAERETIAERLTGGKNLEVRWMREFRGAVEGVAYVAPPGGEPRVIVTHGRTLLVLRPDGRTETKISGNLVAGRVVPSQPDIEGGYSLLSYRLGGAGVSRVDLPDKSTARWEAPAPVFDARWVDPHDPQAGAALGTLTGLVQVDREGRTVRTADIGLVRGLVRHPAADGAAAAPAWLALTGSATPRKLQVLDSDLSTISSQETNRAPWRLEGAGADGHFGLLPSSARALAVGHFFAGVEQDQIAVAGDGQLVILAAESGKELFRARWDEVGDLAAGDLDGDGLDELCVVWGRRLAALAEILDQGE